MHRAALDPRGDHRVTEAELLEDFLGVLADFRGMAANFAGCAAEARPRRRLPDFAVVEEGLAGQVVRVVPVGLVKRTWVSALPAYRPVPPPNVWVRLCRPMMCALPRASKLSRLAPLPLSWT